MSNTLMYSVNVDKKGTVTSAYQNLYDISPLAFKKYIRLIDGRRIYTNYINNGSFFSAPMTSEKVFSKREETVLSPIEFLFKKADKETKGEVIWCVIPMPESNWVLQFNDNNSGVRLYKLKK